MVRQISGLNRERHNRVGDVVVGGIMATIGQLRSATLLAGFPVSVPVKKVDRLCSSGNRLLYSAWCVCICPFVYERMSGFAGLQAVADVAMAIHGGLYDCAIAAGVESMSTGCSSFAILLMCLLVNLS